MSQIKALIVTIGGVATIVAILAFALQSIELGISVTNNSEDTHIQGTIIAIQEDQKLLLEELVTLTGDGNEGNADEIVDIQETIAAQDILIANLGGMINSTVSEQKMTKESPTNTTQPILEVISINPTNPPIEPSQQTNNLFTITPLGNTCLTNEKYCSLEIQVEWNNIDLNNGFIYLVGYHPDYADPGPLWWIAGSGINPITTSGNGKISNGKFGIPDDSVQLYICQVATDKYMYTYDGEVKQYPSPPDCLIYSERIFLHTIAQ